jgi:hypothetical protein
MSIRWEARIERRVWQVGELPDGDVTSAHRLEPGVRAWLWVLLGVLPLPLAVSAILP